ncbi:CopG family antitoxin [Marinobacter zhanjiangensis]|uniref:Uncharacterized protein n=1 Tax=Marinobacter zhanjiangensis TaxID=578215 RepID=A0ABQ3AM96_9GAMM|nr:hypothetical protein GCM10007071_01330 [Marinobacter zhanjiangensis]
MEGDPGCGVYECHTGRIVLDRIKIEANKRDMPYQSLIKAWLANDVNENRRA